MEKFNNDTIEVYTVHNNSGTYIQRICMHIIVMPICNTNNVLWVLAQLGLSSCAQTVQQFSLGTYVDVYKIHIYIIIHANSQSPVAIFPLPILLT